MDKLKGKGSYFTYMKLPENWSKTITYIIIASIVSGIIGFYLGIEFRSSRIGKVFPENPTAQ
ncbi:MAG: hypothetical protein HOE90_06455 [Bacteriovoracaceae bacterium]|jgi:hypothetical protein|nr:hypothetical protein [Bacteriovoracaceae bacterium]